MAAESAPAESSRPLRSFTTSRAPGASSATTGTPAAMASASTMPWVSVKEANANTSMAA